MPYSCAVKKTINEVLLMEFEEKSRAAPPMADKDIEKLLIEVKDIRKKLWEGYLYL